MKKRNFSAEFKRESAQLVVDQNYTVAGHAMCSGFIAAATDTGKTVLKNQTADGLYYAVRYLSYMASATVRPEQEASPQWQPGEATRWDAGLLAGS